MQRSTYPQQETFHKRMPIVAFGLFIASVILIGRLISFQFQHQFSPEALSYLETLRDSGYTRTERLADARGLIYDRNGEVLAVNTLEYQIGVSPVLISDTRRASTELAAILGLNELETFEQLNSNQGWVLLAPRVSAEIGQRVAQLEFSGITQASIPRRSYPQGTLAAQILGFVGGDLIGYYGVEGYYQQQLAGRVRDREISNIPFDAPQAIYQEQNGSDLVLTIDRDVQFIAESELLRAIDETGATRGTIIIMDPRNGDVLAMASFPSFDPNAYFNYNDTSQLSNPAISEAYEPGSIMKVFTVAGALEQGVITPDFTYNDQGILEIGGISIRNWDRQAAGTVDVTQILVQSLNVGAANISQQMGPERFYTTMDSFGMGRLTGIDLQGENAGIMYVPGSPDWSESLLGTNSFGQGIATTPLQMLTALNAIANSGLMMQPRVVHQIIDGDRVITSQPSALSRPISAETAATVTQMMVSVVRDGLDEQATVPGYTIAGKTGTAEIPTPVGYERDASIVSFFGFFPADNPQVSVIVKLDRPRDYWASQVAAPVFRRLAERLVILLEIPPDQVRQALVAEGGPPTVP